MLPKQFEDTTNTEDQFAFGTLIRTWRITAHPKITQSKILKYLSEWTPPMLSRLEDGTNAPRFEQLSTIYGAYVQAGVKPSAEQRHQFVKQARRRAAIQRTHKDYHTDEEWGELLLELARIDGTLDANIATAPLRTQPLLAETRHLIDLPEWHEHLLYLLDPSQQQKLIVVRGPAGIGKTSQLMWLTNHLYHHASQATLTIFCDLCTSERSPSP